MTQSTHCSCKPAPQGLKTHFIHAVSRNASDSLSLTLVRLIFPPHDPSLYPLAAFLPPMQPRGSPRTSSADATRTRHVKNRIVPLYTSPLGRTSTIYGRNKVTFRTPLYLPFVLGHPLPIPVSPHHRTSLTRSLLLIWVKTLPFEYRCASTNCPRRSH